MGKTTRQALDLIIREWGANPDMDIQEDRVSLHRLIYLAQRAGMPRMYVFHWSGARGPMSARLKTDIGDLLYHSPHDGPNDRALRECVRAAVRRAADTLALPNDVNAEPEVWEKAVAATIYLREIGYMDEGGNFLKPQRFTRMNPSEFRLARRASEAFLAAVENMGTDHGEPTPVRNA